MKKDIRFQTPQERARASRQKALKMGCVACLAFACVFAVQNMIPLDVYANPGIDANTKFVVAHACGEMEVSGVKKTYLNVVEAVDHYYAHGTRMFEVDFAFSKEGELVGTHKYEYLKGYGNSRRIPFDEYENTLICGQFHGMTSERLFELVKKYPDARFIIDTKEEDHLALYSKLIDDANAAGVDISKSVLPFIFSKSMIQGLEEKYDFEEYMFTNYKAHHSTDELVEIVENNPKIKYLHMFFTDFGFVEINEFNKRGIRVFAHMDHSTPFGLPLNYGCTGIFSDDITEESFILKYKYILDRKLEMPEDEYNKLRMSFAETLGLDFEEKTLEKVKK